MRLEALNQILKLLNKRKMLKDADVKSKDSDNLIRLNSAYLQLLAGCFGMGPMPADTIITAHVYHYLVK